MRPLKSLEEQKIWQRPDCRRFHWESCLADGKDDGCSLGDRISGGIVITKYQHAKGALPPLEIYEAGHPVLDANSVAATARAIDMVKDLGKDDTVLFLISGGGSALLKASYSAFGTAENQFRSFIERRRHRFHEYGPQAFQRR